MTLLCKLLGHKFDLWIDGNDINPTKTPYYINKKLIPKYWKSSPIKLFIVCERCNQPYFTNIMPLTIQVITSKGIKTLKEIIEEMKPK